MNPDEQGQDEANQCCATPYREASKEEKSIQEAHQQIVELGNCLLRATGQLNRAKEIMRNLVSAMRGEGSPDPIVLAIKMNNAWINADNFLKSCEEHPQKQLKGFAP